MGGRERVSEFLGRNGLQVEVREFGESTKNSSLAASALGCTVAEIAKSIVFVGARTAVVVISGDTRVDLRKLQAVTGGAERVASPDEVRRETGYAIGGVPPFPHGEQTLVLVDRSLRRFEHVWAAAGAPNAVFRIGVDDLFRMTGSTGVDFAEGSKNIESS